MAAPGTPTGMIRALIFDFDGLILETETPAYQAWDEIYREFGHPLPKALWLEYIGREANWFDGLAHLETLIGARADRDEMLGVCSSSTPRWVLGHLERLDLRSFFDHVQCRDRPELRAKPAPDLYLAACSGLGVAPGDAIAFEDSRNGMLAAQAAGMRCVVVPNELTVAMDLTEADHRFESFATVSLQALLDRPSADRPS